MERRKYLGHYDNDCIKSIDSRITRIHEPDIVGYVALVQIREVHYPRMTVQEFDCAIPGFVLVKQAQAYCGFFHHPLLALVLLHLSQTFR